jgi:hypothetical protein
MFVSRCCGVFAVFLELVNRFVSCVAICQRETTVLVALFYRGLTRGRGYGAGRAGVVLDVKLFIVFGVVILARGSGAGCRAAGGRCGGVLECAPRKVSAARDGA